MTPSFITQLTLAKQQQRSWLCVGLDPEPQRFPTSWQGQAASIEAFCCAIVEATADLALAFKPQIAYFAAHGAELALERVIRFIRQTCPHLPIILDAKRGDIGSTAEQYAKEAFERYGADAVTLSPYMGWDSIAPYLERYPEKGVFLLCRTSNPGGHDLQTKRLLDQEGHPTVYEHIARQAQEVWNVNGQMGLVVGATYPTELARVRELAPNLPLLIPGVGAQGGDVPATVRAGLGVDQKGLMVINSSRAILYASREADFAQAARHVAQQTRDALNAAMPT